MHTKASKHRHWIGTGAALALLGAVWLGLPSEAHAQYKNMSWGFDAGYIWIWKPSVLDHFGNVVPTQNLPVRLHMGGHLGGEINFKMDADHWWFNTRLNFGFMSYLPAVGGAKEQAFDQQANQTIGLVMELQPIIGVRYYFLTDQYRPYLQAGVSYAHFFTFTSDGGQDCVGGPDLCGAGTATTTNIGAFLHENIGGIHLQPGFEVIVSHDIALHFFIDSMFWIVFNTTPNFSISPSIGVLFYT